MKNLLIGLLLAGVVAGLFVLNGAARRPDGSSMLNVAKPFSMDVETAAPQATEIVRTVQAPGDVEAYDEVDISSELVSKIVEMPVASGSEVQKDDLLCRLDDAEYRARVLSAEANVAKLKAMVRQAEADFAKADRDFQRCMGFAEQGSASSIELADYHTRQIGAEAVLEMRRQELIEAEAMLQSAREDLAKTVITAPISGVISQLFAKQGEVVVTGTMNNPGTRIMVVSDLSKMIVRCRVDEGDAPLVEPDQPARIYLQSNTRRSVPGRVLSVATGGTKVTGRDVVTFEALVLIEGGDESESVKPGMTANVEIEVDRRSDALTVPVEAVVYRKRRDLPEELVKAYDERVGGDVEAAETGAQYVKLIFCIADDKAHARLVETGISDTQRVEIVGGLSAGEQVVTGPYRSLDQLADGAPVKVTKSLETAPAPEALAEKDGAPSPTPEATKASAD